MQAKLHQKSDQRRVYLCGDGFRNFPRNLAPDFTHYFSERPEVTSHRGESKEGQKNLHIAMPHQIRTYTELRQKIHDDLRLQHPEWVQPGGESPICDSYDARLMELLDALTRTEVERLQESPTI
jgi:hypothetical protein